MIPDQFVDVGVAIHLLGLGWGALALLVIAGLFTWFYLSSGGGELSGLGAVLTGLFGAVVGLIWIAVLIPFDGRYHHVYAVEGTVVSVSNVLDTASGDLTRTPVVELDSVDVPLVVDDPRAVELVGRDVTLLCRIGWNHLAADTYTCSIREWDR